MKTLLLNLWAWVLLHPAEVSTAIVSLLGAIAAATVANARAKGAPVGLLARFVDRLAVKTRQGASNAGWSWPAFGRSVFEAAVEASLEPRETQAPPPPSEPGFAETRILAAIAVASALALVALLAGCSARETLRNSVRPLGLYEVQHPLHGGCHELGVRAHSDTLNRAVVVYGGVCVGINDSGAAADAAGGE